MQHCFCTLQSSSFDTAFAGVTCSHANILEWCARGMTAGAARAVIVGKLPHHITLYLCVAMHVLQQPHHKLQLIHEAVYVWICPSYSYAFACQVKAAQRHFTCSGCSVIKELGHNLTCW